MPMFKAILLLPLLLAVTLNPGPANAASSNTTLHTVGFARDVDNRVVYIEHHRYQGDGTHLVDYYDGNWNLLLEKQLQYPDLPYHPEFSQVEIATGNRIVLTHEGGEAKMRKERSYDNKVRQFKFDLEQNVIVDAGFDAYIRTAWESFDESPCRDIAMAVAGQLRLLDMELCQTTAGSDRGSEDTRGFEITPKNWLVKLILPKINLTYSADQRLKQYQGISNLSEGRSAGTVTIDFEHHLDNPLPALQTTGRYAINTSENNE